MNRIAIAGYMALQIVTGVTVTDYSAVEPGTDLYLLAHVICGEAQNCPREEQEYVGSVVLNRVKSDRFPDTLSEVIYQTDPIQYACVWDGNFDREPTQTNWEVADELLRTGSVLPDDVVWQSAEPQGDYTYLQTKYHYYCGG